MKILFISSSPINKSVSIGNTFLNVFDGVENVDFASLYTRNGLPDACISSAFRITEKMILKMKDVGEEVVERYSGEENIDSTAVHFAKKKRWTIFFWVQSLIWKVPFWKNKNLKKFLTDYQPDIIFTVFNDSSPLNNLIRYVQQQTKKPLVVYAWDDNYAIKTAGRSPLKKLNRLFSRVRMRKLAKMAKEFFVISKTQKEDYEQFFERTCKILTKSADFLQEPNYKSEFNKPLQLIFTGNIGMNRWRSLAIVAETLKRINQNGIKAQLRIYTSSILTEEIKKSLNIKGSSYLMGSVSANEVQTLQRESDILVHVEGLDEQSKIDTRCSFSTKLVDYFKAARPILAVGPRGVASIEHLITNDCAIVVDNPEMLYKELLKIIGNAEALDNLAHRAYMCGKNNHNRKDMNLLLESSLQKLL